eukprot:Skav235961  [mRNA]  locus=scaffold592:76384:84416:- [translate_table: standard]
MADGSPKFEDDQDDSANSSAQGVSPLGDSLKKNASRRVSLSIRQAGPTLSSLEATKFMNSVYLANFIVIVVFLDAYSTCRDIDARAKGQEPPRTFILVSDVCLVLYTVELSLHVYLQGFQILRDWMIFLDFGIIVCGYIEQFLDVFLDQNVMRIGVVRALRLVRIFRLIRLLRKIRTLRELHKLATMMVMDAELLLFKTVIAGDSWGEIAVPVIEQYPATAFIFMGSQEKNEERKEGEKKGKKQGTKGRERNKKDWKKGKKRLNKDCAQRDADFQSRLRVMDIDESDLQMLFEMIDADQSGTIEAAEFIGPLSRWAHDSKTAPRFIKYNMLQTMQLQEDLYDMCQDCFKHLALQIDKVAVDVKGVSNKMNKFQAQQVLPKPQKNAAPDDSPVLPRPGPVIPKADDGKGATSPGLVDEGSRSSRTVELGHVASRPSARPSHRPSAGPAPRPSARPDTDDEQQDIQDHLLTIDETQSNPEMDSHSDMEHVMALRPSLATSLLNEILENV